MSEHRVRRSDDSIGLIITECFRTGAFRTSRGAGSSNRKANIAGSAYRVFVRILRKYDFSSEVTAAADGATFVFTSFVFTAIANSRFHR